MAIPVKAEAMPIAGASKILAQRQVSAGIHAPIAEWQQKILDKATQEEKRHKAKKKPIYVYSSSKTLNSYDGVFYGPSGKESFYNLNMSGVVRRMRTLGYTYPYWVRNDGVKMLGDYVMVAADLSIRPKGTVLPTSLGQAIVCDTGEFVHYDRMALDVAVDWS